MYAIIEDGGRQFKVQPGDVVAVDVRDLEEGQNELVFEQVLYCQDGEEILVGRPVIEGAKVLAKVLGPASGPKLHAMQRRRRKDSQRRVGHRQKYLEVEITAISKA